MASEIEVKGYADLIKKMDRLEAKAGQKVIARILSKASNPLKVQWRAKAPVRGGSRLKKTYKGRYVAPGFLKRSIRSKQITRGLRKAVALVVAGVADEAFYGPQFFDEGVTVTGRRPRGKNKIKKAVKPYRLQGYKWYYSTYQRNIPTIIRKISSEMEAELAKLNG